MSCTENDSGPFVVFLLPAVVGCLTILLARRWANSQVTSTSSTAVSRRRKIIKDPHIKRPLPPIQPKMVAPGLKKANGGAKKGVTFPDEDLNGGKRLGRSTRLATCTNLVQDVKQAEGPIPPKHIPFPYIPYDGELLFEAMTFMFTIVATGLQFLNLYRTVWWLPHSHTNQAMHFYLIDPHLVAFIVTMLVRRLLLSLTLATLRAIVSSKVLPHAIQAARMFILGMVLGALAWCTYFIAVKYPLSKIFYLCYPAVIYFILFGFTSSPFLELVSSPPPLHGCGADVRAEAAALRGEVNDRLKRVLFNSVLGAYYSSFVPCCFAQSYLYYDVYAAAQQVALVWGGLCARLASHLLPAWCADVAHRVALHLGRWTPVKEGYGRAAEWSPQRVYGAGERVTWRGNTYVAGSATVCGEPGDKHHDRFYTVFINPSMLLCFLLCLQLSLIILQICLLFSSIAWHNFLAIVILLFTNYYTLFKMVRDYLVAWKVYKAENMIQERHVIVNGN